MNLLEAFVKLDEDAFDTTPKGIEDLSNFMDDADVVDDEIEIIDPDINFDDDDTMPADDEESEEENAHVGQLVLQCNTCNALVYKDKDEVELDDDGNVEEEECPNCHNVSKFDVIGKICTVDDLEDELEGDEEESEEKEEDESEKPEDESKEEVETDDDEVDDEEEEKSIKEESLRRPNKRSLKEGVEQLDFDVDPDETVIYLFPLLWWEDVDVARGFGLWMNEDFSDKDTTAISGRFEDLVDFADNYLDYQLADGYLLDENGDEIRLNESLRKPRRKLRKESLRRPNRKSLKENRQKLNEGPGAGYTVSGDLTDIRINSFDFKVNGDEVVVNCDIDATLENVEAYSYYYGGEVGYEVPVKISQVSYYIYDDSQLNDSDVEEELEYDLSHLKFKAYVGGGWSHSTFDGNLEVKDIRHWNGEDSDIFNVIMHCTNEDDIQDIDDLVTGRFEEDEEEFDESLRRPRKIREAKQRLNETLMDAVLDRIDGVPYNPREFYQYVNAWDIDWYNDVAHEMDEGEEEDVANAIIRGLQNSIRGDGGDPHNPSAEQLYKFVKDSTWLTNDRTGDVPEYIKNIHNELYSESLKKPLRKNRKVRKESLRRPNRKSLKESKERKLSDDEWNAISKFTHNIKLDDSFDIQYDDDHDYFYDFDEDEELTLGDGLELLADSIAYPLSHDGMSDKEAKNIVNVFRRYGIGDEKWYDWLLSEDVDESLRRKSRKISEKLTKKSSPKDKILKDIEKLKKESLKEDLEGITVDTDEETIQITQKEDGGVAVETSPKGSDEPFMEEPMFEEPPVEGDEVSGDEEVIEPLTDEEEEEIAEENPESEEDEEEIEDIDSDSFDELGESYLKEAYENVKSFKTSKVYKKNGKLVVEGIVSFKSGKNKKTSFIFESAHNKSKKKVLLGENKQITPNSKSFRLRGVVKDKKMVCESLRYNYKEGKNRVSGVCRVK